MQSRLLLEFSSMHACTVLYILFIYHCYIAQCELNFKMRITAYRYKGDTNSKRNKSYKIIFKIHEILEGFRNTILTCSSRKSTECTDQRVHASENLFLWRRSWMLRSVLYIIHVIRMQNFRNQKISHKVEHWSMKSFNMNHNQFVQITNIWLK